MFLVSMCPINFKANYIKPVNIKKQGEDYSASLVQIDKTNPNDIKAKDLPTDLNGVTADLKPGQPYFASAKHRMGKRTSFDLLGGLERYLSSAKNQIYHIDDIQTLRALRNYIADTYGQAHAFDDIDS